MAFSVDAPPAEEIVDSAPPAEDNAPPAADSAPDTPTSEDAPAQESSDSPVTPTDESARADDDSASAATPTETSDVAPAKSGFSVDAADGEKEGEVKETAAEEDKNKQRAAVGAAESTGEECFVLFLSYF